MSIEQTAVDQADFDEMSMIAEQHEKKEDDVTCSDVIELEEARVRIVELELERDELKANCEVIMGHLYQLSSRLGNGNSLDNSISNGIVVKALEQTPKQSLAEIQAKAIEDAANRFRGTSIARGVLMCHAAQLRAKSNE